MPCDAAIITGTCIMDESGLTGESMPQQKVAVPNNEPASRFDPGKAGKKYVLFAGTHCLQSADGDQPAQAVVLQTGMRTQKGELLKGILWPKKLVFKFTEHMHVVVVLLSLWAGVAFTIAILIKVDQGRSHVPTLFLYACATCTQIVSPLIPALLVVGQTAAASRLRKQGTFCVSPKRITVAGKVRAMCFDKTGTLTKVGLDFLGPCPVVDGKLMSAPVPLASPPAP